MRPPRSGILRPHALLRACILAVPLTLTGCAGTTPDPATVPLGELAGPDGEMTLLKLDGLTKAYADRYMTLVVSACDEIAANNPSLEQRRMANLFKTASVTAIYDVATNPDPFTQLIDMLLVVTLQTMVWIDEDHASEVFPEREEILVLALRRAREDIWDLARQVMTPNQLNELDRLMVEWRRENRDVQFVSFVRFGDFANRRGQSILAEVRSGGGLLAPTRQAIDETRLLAERVFYLAKRTPFLISWQAQAAADDLLIKPEISGTLEQVEKVAAAADRAATAAESLPAAVAAEREALLTAFDEREEQLHAALESYRAAVADSRLLVQDVDSAIAGTEQALGAARAVSESLTELARTLDALMARHANAPADPDAPSRPFDINEYAAAVQDLTVTVRELNTLVASTGSLIDSRAFEDRLDQLNAAVANHIAATRTEAVGLMDHAFRRAVMLAVVVCILAILYRGVSLVLTRMLRTRDASHPNNPSERPV